MIEITPEREEGFGYGVVYERTRILDSLRLSMQPVLDHFEKLHEAGEIPEGMVPVIALEEVINWAMITVEQPVHSMKEADKVAEESLSMAMQQLRERGLGHLADEIDAMFEEGGDES